jgi:hypothetical protein
MHEDKMRPIPWLLAAGAATLIASAAQAQGMSQDAGAAPPPPPPANSAPLGSADHPIPQNSPTPADQAFHLKAGDPNVVSNQPVPDTPENRAAYGQPMSHGGKATRAAGN